MARLVMDPGPSQPRDKLICFPLTPTSRFFFFSFLFLLSYVSNNREIQAGAADLVLAKWGMMDNPWYGGALHTAVFSTQLK